MTRRRPPPARPPIAALILAGCSPAATQTPTPQATTNAAASAEHDAGAVSSAEHEAEEQLRATVSLGFDSERLATRARLATAVPESPAGYFSRAWLAGREGNHDERVRLLEECLRRWPGYDLCIAHQIDELPDTTTDAQFIALYDAAAARGQFPWILVPGVYRRMHDRSAALSWLAAREQEHPRSFIFDFTRAAELEGRSASGAADLYRRALLEKEGYYSNLAENLINLIAGGLHDETRDDRIRELGELLPEMERRHTPRDVAQAWFAAGVQVRDRLNDKSTAGVFFLHAYELFPSVDAAHAAFDVLVLSESERAGQTLRAARERFPEDPTLRADEARWKYLVDADFPAAEQLYQQAVDSARDGIERRELIDRFGWEFLQRVGHFDRVLSLVASVPASLRDERMLDEDYNARLRSGDFAAASDALVRWRDSLSSARETFFLSQRERAASYTSEPLPLSRTEVFTPWFVAGSRDGRFYSSGTEPSRVYDAATGHALADLRRGGPRWFSPDGRYIAATVSFVEQSGAHTFAVVVYETATGRLVRFYDVLAEVRGFAWHPASDRLAWFDFEGLVTEANVVDGTRRQTRGAPTRRIGQLAYAAGGRFLLTAAAEANQVVVRRTSDLGVERTLEGVSWVHGMTSTADGRYVVCADNALNLTVYDSRDWSMRQLHLPATASLLVPHPSEPVVVLSGGFRDHATVVNVERMEIVRELGGRWEGSASFLGPDKILVETTTGMDTISYPSFRTVATRAKVGTGGLGIVALDDGTRVGVRLAHRIAVVDAATGAEGRHWPISGPMRVRPQHHQLVTVAGHTLHVLDTQNGHDTRHELPISFDVQSISVSENRVAVAGVRGADPGGQHMTPDTGGVAVFEIDSGAAVWQHDVPVVTGSLRDNRLYRSNVRVALDADGQRVAYSTSWQEGFGNLDTFSRDVRVWQFGRTSPEVIHTGTEIQDIKFSEPGVVQVWHLQDYETFAANNGQRTGAGQYQLPLPGGAAALWGMYRIEVVDPRGHVLGSHDFEADVVGIVPLADGSVAGLDGTGAVVRVAGPPAH